MINQCISKQSKRHRIHKALHILNDFCINMVFFLALKDLEERVRHLRLPVRQREYILHLYTKRMEWNYNNCLCCTSLSAVEWIKAVSSSWGSLREFCPDRFTLLYPFFRTEWVGALTPSLSPPLPPMLVPFWLRIGALSETKATPLLPFVRIYSSGPEVWLGLSTVFVSAHETVALFASVLFNGSSWAAELPRSDDRWRFLSAVYLALLTSA